MSKIKIISCSGIGKVYGLLAREAILKVTNELRPHETETLCLGHIVTGDDEVKSKIEGLPCITMDGCPKLCAAKSVALAGGIVVAKFRSIDAMKDHKGVDAGTATALTKDGFKIVDELAAKICVKVDEILKEAK